MFVSTLINEVPVDNLCLIIGHKIVFNLDIKDAEGENVLWIMI